MFFHEYIKTNSWFPRSKYENLNNPKQYYDPELAIELLAKDGWTRKDGDKWMTNDEGEIFEIKEFFIYPNWDRIFNPFIEDLEQVGLKVSLVEIQNHFEKSMKKKFKLEQYNECWNPDKRIKILQELDYIASSEYHWIFGWAAPYGYRCLHWNKFSMPENSLGYSGNWSTPLSLWWIDPNNKTNLKSAQNENSNLPIDPEIVDYYISLEK